MRLYIASSWRNPHHDSVVETLKSKGYDVYNYRESNASFHWKQIDPHWEQWSLEKQRAALTHPVARNAFDKDSQAMEWADACVLLLPSGASSHLEAGWFLGKNRPVFIFVTESVLPHEPELTYKRASAICLNEQELLINLGIRELLLDRRNKEN